ncbi:hypothetical protein HJFPF1_12033 [Paramyrothecium foliicola]|nr:hypothetical protein HJFPF1_12033 [Paramyrothecium foliicola]
MTTTRGFGPEVSAQLQQARESSLKWRFSAAQREQSESSEPLAGAATELVFNHVRDFPATLDQLEEQQG